MLRIIFSTLMLCICTATFAQINLPALSPSVKISQKLGLTTAILSYSRPSLHGRELFGEKGILVMGKKWRTGANATTKIELDKNIIINGQVLSKGIYALLSTPEETSWTFHFYPYEKGAYTQFLKKQAILDVTVPTQQLNYELATLSLHFEDISLSSANLVLQWSKYKVVIPIQLDEHESILANIEKKLEGPSDFDYYQAALYLHETQTNLPLALSYIQKVTQNDAALFFQVYREALILRDLNKKAAAIIAAKRSKEISAKAGNDDFVRLSQQIIDELRE